MTDAEKEMVEAALHLHDATAVRQNYGSLLSIDRGRHGGLTLQEFHDAAESLKKERWKKHWLTDNSSGD